MKIILTINLDELILCKLFWKAPSKSTHQRTYNNKRYRYNSED